MCQTDAGNPESRDSSDSLESIVRAAAAATGVAVVSVNPPPQTHAQGSRRRRLWELDGHVHCPVIGVCMPIAALRRLVGKTLGGRAAADDYELHCGVITDCQLRSPIAEAVQRDLDQRYQLPLRLAAKAKTTEALEQWWADALCCHDVAGALWATLTHARCTPALQYRVLGEVHMLQHQAGMAARVDLDRFEALIDENAVLTRELAGAQQRSTRQVAEHTQRSDAQQREIVQLRAQLIARDTALAHLREDLQTLEAAVPGLKSRADLGRENQHQAERIHALERALLQSQQDAERKHRRAEGLAAELRQQRDAPTASSANSDDAAFEAPHRLDDRAVLCVGGRPAAVPLYRHIVEKVGGRFLHHDGGEEESSAKLDSTLAAADLVICQTGCISHNAYWRVKDHCKRTGKRCVFVESPSSAGIKRALLELVPVRPIQAKEEPAP